MGVVQAEQNFDRGRRIGKYEIVTRLSVGGMAELFLAFTSGPGGFRKYVALKQILPDVAKDQDFVKMFLDEARITAAFSHANVGSVFDLGQEGQELYLAMEFISGQNLQQILKAAQNAGQPLPAGFSARVARDACLGLHYAHTFVDRTGTPSPVIHRDVSPKNVMVSYDGEVKVIDFGIAKAKNRLGKTQVGIVKGTRGYMSPEQVKGARLDGRSDLFCMGVILYEMLAGEKLFATQNDAAVMIEIVEGAPPQVPRGVPDALADVALRALERDRDRRFASGKEMARALDAALGPELFDDEALAEVLSGLFARERENARQLLEDADSIVDLPADPAASARTAPVPAPARKSGMRPAPRSGGSKPHPVAGGEFSRAPRRTAGATPRPRATPQEVVETDVRSSSPRLKGQEAVATDVRATLTPRGRGAPEQPAAPRKSRRGIVVLVLVLLLGGAAFTPWAAPVRAWVAPRVDKLISSVRNEMREPPPPDTSIQALPDDVVAKMKARQEQLESEAKAKAEEKARIDRELAALDAREAAERERVKALQEAQEEEERRASARPPRVKTGVKDREPVDVLDTKTGAAAARSGLGWLTLYTVPPAAVYDGANLLGTTPLNRVPLAFGVYRLTVVDPDGTRHVLSAHIEKGKEAKVVVSVSDIPLERVGP